MEKKVYRIKKLYVSGSLKGLVFEEFIDIPLEVGRIYHGISSSFKVLEIKEIDE